MAEENVSDAELMIAEENEFDAKPEKGSVEMIPAAPEESTGDVPPPMFEGQKDIPEIHEVSVPEDVSLRRHSTGVMDIRPGKAKVQPRYLSNHVGSTHDICKHGKRRQDDVVKPWKMVRKKSVEGEDAEKTDSLGMRRKSLGGGRGQISGSRPKKLENCPPAKREAAAVVEKPCFSLNSESSISKEASDAVKSADGSSVKRSCQTGKNSGSENSPSDSAVVRKITGLRNEKMKIAVKKVPDSTKRSKDEKEISSSKNRQKTKTEPVCSEEVPEKTLYVVESSVERKSTKAVQGEAQRASGKKITRSVKNSTKVPKDVPSSSPSSEDKVSRTTKLEPRLTRQSSRAKTRGISPISQKKKESAPANLGALSRTESKNKSKRIGIKVSPLTRQLSFKRGKVLEPKSEDSTPTWIKFRRRVAQEGPKIKSDGRKKNLKNKRDGDGKSNSTEGSKPEKVVLRHRKVEAKKKLQTLFNNVIEETASKLAEVRKSKVKALVGAFETVISLQDNKSSKKVQSRATTSAVGALYGSGIAVEEPLLQSLLAMGGTINGGGGTKPPPKAFPFPIPIRAMVASRAI